MKYTAYIENDPARPVEIDIVEFDFTKDMYANISPGFSTVYNGYSIMGTSAVVQAGSFTPLNYKWSDLTPKIQLPSVDISVNTSDWWDFSVSTDIWYEISTRAYFPDYFVQCGFGKRVNGSTRTDGFYAVLPTDLLKSSTMFTRAWLEQYITFGEYIYFSDNFRVGLSPLSYAKEWIITVNGVDYKPSGLSDYYDGEDRLCIINNQYITPYDRSTVEETISGVTYSGARFTLYGYYGVSDPDTFIPKVQIADLTSFFNYTPPQPKDPMYSDETSSSQAGGGGTFDFTSDSIGKPAVPTGMTQPVRSLMYTLFTPSVLELQALTSTFWETNFWKEIISLLGFQDPYKSIISMHMLPFYIEGELVTDDAAIGGVSTGVAMHATEEQFREIDFGELDYIEPLRGNFLDYPPYTNITAFLPYIGELQISPSDVFGHVVGLKYILDIANGAISAIITVDDQPRYNVSGNCMTPIPVTGQDSGIFARIAANTAMAGAGVIGGMIGVAASGSGAIGAMKVASNAASTVGSSMTPILTGRMGAVGSSVSLMSLHEAYIAIDTVREVIPDNYARNYGWTTNLPTQLSNVHGYTVVDSVHVENIGCLPEERAEIQKLLTEGVILP